MSEDSWHSYPDSNALGHRMLKELFFDAVVIEEKVDGSQFSFGKFNDELHFRSKGAQIYVTPEGHSSEKMFEKAVQSVLKRQFALHEGWTYRVEYLPKTKAVTLAYTRVPEDYLIGFDVEIAEEHFLNPDEKRMEFERIGLETVPCFFQGRVEDIELVKSMLEHVSVLGGQQVEGVVVKNYNRYGPDKKILIGKYVSKAFKEMHGREWAKGNPKSGDILQEIIESVRTPARWRKGVQHLREAGKLTDTPKDIALLFREVPADIKKECEADTRRARRGWAWDKISRGATAGMAEWYKERLLEGQAVPGYEPKGPDYMSESKPPKSSAELEEQGESYENVNRLERLNVDGEGGMKGQLANIPGICRDCAHATIITRGQVEHRSHRT